jgi:hypothetical protein
MNACKEQYPGLKVRYCATAEEVAVEADALVVVTEWAEFRKLDLVKMAATMNNPILIDGRNLFPPEDVLVPDLIIPASAARSRTRSHRALSRPATAADLGTGSPAVIDPGIR